jgi:hypothetical protein
MLCLHCGKDIQSGKSYRFYFGKRGETDFPDRRTTRTKYSLGNWEDTFLCDDCVDTTIDLRARKTAAAVFLIALAFAILRLLLGPAPQGSELETVIGFPIAFIGGFIVYKGIQSWKKGKQREDEGQRLAIKTRKPALVSQGYDAFFIQSDYDRLVK